MRNGVVAAVTAALVWTSATPTAEAIVSDAAVLLPGVVAEVEPKPKPGPREYARRATRSANDYRCLVVLWMRESNWNHKADNPKSSAYGIAQMLGETSKDPYKQIDKGLKYIKHRYGTACAALRFRDQHGWY